jgi:hypothetical protein
MCPKTSENCIYSKAVARKAAVSNRQKNHHHGGCVRVTNITIKVQGGTQSDAFLCETCANGTIMRGGSMKQIAVRCSEGGVPFPVPFRVVQCNAYNEKYSTDLMKMRNDAFYIFKTAHGGVHVITEAQITDYDYTQDLEKEDKRLWQQSRQNNARKNKLSAAEASRELNARQTPTLRSL